MFSNYISSLLCSLFTVSCLSVAAETPPAIIIQPISPQAITTIQPVENNENDPSVLEEGIVSNPDLDGIVDLDDGGEPDYSTSTVVALATPAASNTINYIESFASAQAVYAPKDFAPLDPVGDQYAKWLETAWINAVVPANNDNATTATENTVVNDDSASSSIDAPIIITVVTSTPTSTLHLVINAVSIGTASSTIDEFVEIYNPTALTINLSGWKLERVTASGKTENYLVRPFPDGASIKSHGYFLIAHPAGYSTGTPDRVLPDLVYTTASSVASSNSIILFNSGGEVIDLVGYGQASQFEGAPAAELLNDGQVLTRIEAIDTDHNDVDFKLMAR